MPTQTAQQQTSPNYQRYYTSSDCSVFLEDPKGLVQPILLDRLNTIQFSENLDSQPVFGLGNSKLGFFTQGNLFVEGTLILNFVHENYLANALQVIYQGQPSLTVNSNDLANLTPQQFNNLSDSSLSQIKTAQQNNKSNQRNFSTSIINYPAYFDMRIVFNNSFLYTQDQDKELLIKSVKITGSSTPASIMGEQGDDPILAYYSFKAREVATGTV